MIGLTPINNDYYLQSIDEFPPCPIVNHEHLIATQNRINTILDRVNINQDDRDYLKILGMLVYDYEEKNEVFPQLKPIDILDDLINNQNVKTTDLLDIFKTELNIFDILNHQREITPEEAQKLNNYAFELFHG